MERKRWRLMFNHHLLFGEDTRLRVLKVPWHICVCWKCFWVVSFFSSYPHQGEKLLGIKIISMLEWIFLWNKLTFSVGKSWLRNLSGSEFEGRIRAHAVDEFWKRAGRYGLGYYVTFHQIFDWNFVFNRYLLVCVDTNLKHFAFTSVCELKVIELESKVSSTMNDVTHKEEAMQLLCKINTEWN